MNYVSKLLNNNCELTLAIIFILFLISNTRNEELAAFVDKPEVKIYIIVIAVLLFVFCNKLVGILAIFVVYEMLLLSHSLQNIPITTTPVFSWFENKSIEEEIIYNILPFSGMSYDPFTIKPFNNYLGYEF